MQNTYGIALAEFSKQFIVEGRKELHWNARQGMRSRSTRSHHCFRRTLRSSRSMLIKLCRVRGSRGLNRSCKLNDWQMLKRRVHRWRCSSIADALRFHRIRPFIARNGHIRAIRRCRFGGIARRSQGRFVSRFFRRSRLRSLCRNACLWMYRCLRGHRVNMRSRWLTRGQTMDQRLNCMRVASRFLCLGFSVYKQL